MRQTIQQRVGVIGCELSDRAVAFLEQSQALNRLLVSLRRSGSLQVFIDDCPQAMMMLLPNNFAQPRLYACKKAFFVDLMAHSDNRGMRQEALDRAEKLEGIDPLQSRFGDHQIEGPVSQRRVKIPFPGDLDARRARKPILQYAYDAGAILWIVIDNQKPRTLIPVTAPHIFHVPLERLGPHHQGLGKG